MTDHTPPSEQQLREQIEQLQQQLAQAQKMSVLGELLSTTTHEFNNVLMSVINYAKMGLRHSDDATRVKCFEKILAAGERAGQISKSVLGAARNRSESPEATDLAQLIDDVLVLLQRELRKYRIAVEKDFQPAPPALVVGNQIQQVLINLMVNARQAMPDGGQLMITVSHDAAAGSVDVKIRDTGSGIAADKLPRIFDRYYSTKTGPDESGKGGTGLGLAACKDIIDSHRGRMKVESSPGKGTAFTIKLPVAKRPSTPAPHPAILSPTTSRSTV